MTAFATAGRGDASGYDPAELVRQAIAELDGDPSCCGRSASGRAGCSSTSTRTPIRRRSSCSTARRRRRQPGRRRRSRPGHLRLPRRRAARHRRVPDRFRHTDGRSAAGSPWVCAAGRARTAGISRTVAEGLPGPWEHRRLAGRRHRSGNGEVHVFGSAAVEAAYLADVLRRAHLLEACRGRRWPSLSAPPARWVRCAGPCVLGGGPGRGLRRRSAPRRPARRGAPAQRADRAAAGGGAAAGPGRTPARA